MTKEKHTCHWEVDSPDCIVYYRETSCGNSVYLTDRPVRDLNFKYCPYCGGDLVEVEQCFIIEED